MKNFLQSHKNLFTLLSIGLVITNIGYFTQSILGGLIALAFFLFVPGYLVVSRLKDVKLDGWVNFSLSFGLSLLFVMVGGLLLNSLHYMGVDRPLSPNNLFIFFAVATAVLLWFARKNLRKRQLSMPAISRERVLFATALSALPLLGAFGAIRLNNGGSGIVTMIGLGGAAVLFLLLLWRKRLSSLYPYAVFAIGLTVLLALSMRSWFVSGHDVGHEFYLFNQVVQHGFWSNQLSFVGDTYNACMSITILPTAVAAISGMSGEYVFKLLMQVIFAVGLIPMYLLAKRFTGSRRALLVSLLFIGFPTFVNDMPFLVRQEIAFVFFVLLLMTAFLQLGRRLVTYLVIAFMAGIILSHYSSGYVALAILIMAWVVYWVAKKLIKSKGTFYTPLLSLPVLMISLLFTFFWNAQITATAGTLGSTIKSTIVGVFNGSSTRSNSVSYSLVSGGAKTSEEVLADYAGDKKDLVKLVPEKNMAPTALTANIVSENALSTFNSFFRGVSAKALQVLLLIGIGYFIVRNRLSAKRRDIYFYSLAVGSVAMMALITVLPQLSVDYGLTRLFLQTMVIVGVPIIVGLELLSGLVRRFKLALMSAGVALFFLHLSGFMPQLIGGYPPQMTLNNAGYYYDIYYKHKGELIAAQFFNGEHHEELHISADKYASSRLQDVTKRGPITDPVRSTDTSDYLYKNYANVHEGVYANFIQGNVIEYEYEDPLQANLLYDNQASRIYLRERSGVINHE